MILRESPHWAVTTRDKNPAQGWLWVKPMLSSLESYGNCAHTELASPRPFPMAGHEPAPAKRKGQAEAWRTRD